jgi:hypothetical protein
MCQLPPSPHTPLLTDEELAALIEAFNRRESTPRRRLPARVGWMMLALSVLGLGWWWI